MLQTLAHAPNPQPMRRTLVLGALTAGVVGCGGGFSISFGGPGFGIGLGVVFPIDDDDLPSGAVVRDLSAPDFASFTTRLGEPLAALPGVAPPALGDIQSLHFGDRSRLTANVLARQIQASNLNELQFVDSLAARRRHVAVLDFRLPAPPGAGAALRGHSLEGGLFVRDSAAAVLGFGAAFQWRVDPLSADYGRLYTWRADGANRFWVEIGRIEPDTQWHRLRVEIDPFSQRAALAVDGIIDSLALAREATPGWSSNAHARLHVQTTSAPPSAAVAPQVQQTEFRNWRWQWLL